MIDNFLDSLRAETNISDEEWNSKISKNGEEIANIFSKVFSKTFPAFIQKNKISEMNKGLSKFQRELNKDYKKAFKSLDTFSFLFNHFGVEYFKSKERKKDVSLRNFILRRLFYRGIQINNEIFYLVKGGFPHAALARWRSLHEVAIVFIFLKNGSDELIEMYYDYDAVERYKRVKALAQHHKTLKWPSPTTILSGLENQVKDLEKKYGKDYTKEYGWTMQVLEKGKRRISGLEEYVELNYLRAFYSYASDDIHSGVGALYKDIEIAFEKFVANWGGRMMFGFIDAVQLTTSTLCTLLHYLTVDEDTLSNYIYLQMVKDWHSKVVDDFHTDETNLKALLNEAKAK